MIRRIKRRAKHRWSIQHAWQRKLARDFKLFMRLRGIEWPSAPITEGG